MISSRVQRAVMGIEVIVSVENQVGVMFVEQLPEGFSGNALRTDAVCGAERGLMPIGGRARRVIFLEILFQP
jgi:hypothetical protein